MSTVRKRPVRPKLSKLVGWDRSGRSQAISFPSWGSSQQGACGCVFQTPNRDTQMASGQRCWENLGPKVPQGWSGRRQAGSMCVGGGMLRPPGEGRLLSPR